MRIRILPTVIALAASTALLTAEEIKPAGPSGTSGADSTRVTTEQSGAPADLQITADIIKAIKAEDSLSASAKLIRVVTANNTVILHGTVVSIAEKSTVDAIARKAAGSMRIDSQLELALDK